MSSEARPERRSTEIPDWVDILLAATIASWATVAGAMTIAMLAGFLPIFRFEMIPFILATVAMIVGMTFFIAMYVCVILGLPALGIAKLFKLNQRWHAALLGAFAGFLVTLVIPGLSVAALREDSIFGVILFIVAGILAGLAAWRERQKGLA